MVDPSNSNDNSRQLQEGLTDLVTVRAMLMGDAVVEPLSRRFADEGDTVVEPRTYTLDELECAVSLILLSEAK